MTSILQLTSDLRLISLPFQGEQEIIGSYLLHGGNDLVLIDPGPSKSLKTLLASIREAGFNPQDVTHILLTHIHLDHAGATGSLLSHTPQAKVYVHSKGAPHLIDPSRFVASATRIYGNRMQELWGDVEPVPQESLHVIEGGEVLNIAGHRLEVHYTPGHAVHHVIFFDVHSGELFAGDIAGVRLQGVDYVRPPTPPPDLDIEAWSSSIDTLKRLRPDVLYLAHFGPTKNPVQHLERLRERLYGWGDFVLNAMRDGKDEADIVQLLAQQTDPELLRIARDERAIARYDVATNYAMTVQGYMRYWRKEHPERL